MGVLTGGATLSTSTREVVYTSDPDVVVPPELECCGWVPAEQATARAGADIVTIRALTPRERTRMRDVYVRQGEASSYHETCTTAVVSVGKIKLAKDVARWVDRLAQQSPAALDLLARYILALTRGADPSEEYALARSVLGYEPRVEVADAGEEPKSGD